MCRCCWWTLQTTLWFMTRCSTSLAHSQQRSPTWSSPWRCTEATWASLRAPCSSPSPSPGWTKWSWATPTPCASGRNRNRRAKVATWARAPAQKKRRSHSLFISPHGPSLEETPEPNLELLFLVCLLLWAVLNPWPVIPVRSVLYLQAFTTSLLCNHHHLTVCKWTQKKQNSTAFVLLDFETGTCRFSFNEHICG